MIHFQDTTDPAGTGMDQIDEHIVLDLAIVPEGWIEMFGRWLGGEGTQ